MLEPAISSGTPAAAPAMAALRTQACRVLFGIAGFICGASSLSACASGSGGEDSPAQSGAGVGGAGIGGMAGAAAGASGSSVVTAGGIGGGPADPMAGAGGTGGGGIAIDPTKLDRFSFFVTSLRKMRELSGSQDGFGGDLRFGTSSGLEGADKICSTIAESSMTGASAKQWRAFLSTEHGGPDDGPLHAKDRIGEGPWFDRSGNLVAMNLKDLLSHRPISENSMFHSRDFPNEEGIWNSKPDPTALLQDDNHHFLTGSNTAGEWYGKDRNGNSSTCLDWTTRSRKNLTTASGDGPVTGLPQFGFSYEGVHGDYHWISGGAEGGCGAGVTGIMSQNGAPTTTNPIVGSGGGYGGIYCFAMMP